VVFKLGDSKRTEQETGGILIHRGKRPEKERLEMVTSRWGLSTKNPKPEAWIIGQVEKSGHPGGLWGLANGVTSHSAVGGHEKKFFPRKLGDYVKLSGRKSDCTRKLLAIREDHFCSAMREGKRRVERFKPHL